MWDITVSLRAEFGHLGKKAETLVFQGSQQDAHPNPLAILTVGLKPFSKMALIIYQTGGSRFLAPPYHWWSSFHGADIQPRYIAFFRYVFGV